jgi:hypothetical protein
MENTVPQGLKDEMIDIAKEFSRTPAGRYFDDGPATGEKFREEFLIPQLKEYGSVEIILDGTAGYPSSFLEEAFGGLIRKGVMTATEARQKIRLIAFSENYKRYVSAIWSHIDAARPEKH